MAKKMTKKELKVYRELLLERRNMLTGNMDSIGGSVSSRRATASGSDSPRPWSTTRRGADN